MKIWVDIEIGKAALNRRSTQVEADQMDNLFANMHSSVHSRFGSDAYDSRRGSETEIEHRPSESVQNLENQLVAQKLELEKIKGENAELHKKLSEAEKTASNAADLHQKLEQLAAV